MGRSFFHVSKPKNEDHSGINRSFQDHSNLCLRRHDVCGGEGGGGWAKCFKMACGPIVLLISKVRKPSLQNALCVPGALEIACDQSRNIEFKLIETQIIHNIHCLINAHFQILHPQKMYTV